MLKSSSAINAERKLMDFMSHTLLKKMIIQIVYLFMGVLMSKGAILGNYSPFGTAFIAAVPYNNIWMSLVGVVVGYLLPSPVGGGLKYISAVIAIVSIRWTLNDLDRVKRHPLYSPLIAMIPTLAMSITVNFVQGITGMAIIMSLTEAMLSAAGAYFFSRTIKATKSMVGISTMDQQEFACAAMTLFMLLLSVANIDIRGISIGRIFAVLVVLFCAKYAGVAGGSVSGIASGIIFSISSSDFLYLSGSYAFSGMMAGLFSPIGKLGVTLAFIVSNAIVSFESGQAELVISGIYEVMISTVLFMLIPKSVGDKLSGVLSNKKGEISTDSLRKSVVMRLDYVSKALSSISGSVDSVSQKLSKLSSNDIKSVFTKSVNDTCHRCGLKIFCWEKENKDTKKSLEEVKSVLIRDGSIVEKDLSDSFANRCCKTAEMVNSINRYYDEYIAKEAAEQRMGEIRGVIGEQFCGMGELLSDISSEFKNYERFDTEASEKIMNRLRQSGALPIEASCRIDKFSRMSIEIELANTDSRKLNKFVLSKELSKVCGRVLDTPCISYTPDRCRVQISERPQYDIDIASSQHVCNNGKLCGDNFCYFNDGMGRMIAVISDGMGTGGRAAVDGAMTTGIISKLVKAGLGFNSSLRIVNSALIVKSGEESLATIDIACIDLFTGEFEIMKAGAPITFIRRNGGVICVEAPSLPAGILTNIEFSVEKVSLEEDDIVLMMSDGALATGDKWIEEELKDWNEHDVKDLANLIVDKAVERRTDGHDDDITVLAMRIREY